MIEIAKEFDANLNAIVRSKLSAEKKRTILSRLIEQMEVLCESDSEELSLTTTEVTEEEKAVLRGVLTAATKEIQNLVE